MSIIRMYIIGAIITAMIIYIKLNLIMFFRPDLIASTIDTFLLRRPARTVKVTAANMIELASKLRIFDAIYDADSGGV